MSIEFAITFKLIQIPVLRATIILKI
jgi:hypothetical protein